MKRENRRGPIMKKYFYLLAFLVFLNQGLFAQLSLSKIGLNLGTNLLIGDSKISNSEISPNFGAFGILKHSDFLSFKLQAGYGSFGVNFADNNLSTSFIPVELIGIFTLRQNSNFLPFFHAGIGVFGFTLNGSPKYYDGIIIGGGGFSYPISSRFTLITSVDMRYTTGDDFDNINSGLKDGYFNFQTGVAYNFYNNKKFDKEDFLHELKIIAQKSDEIYLSNRDPLINPTIIEPEIAEQELPPDQSDVFAGEILTINFKAITFGFDEASLMKNSQTVLDNMIITLNIDAKMQIEIQGHTDSVGIYVYNLKLSQRRAESVRSYLVKNGIKPERLITQGFSEQYPVASNSTSAGRAQNRRVEFVHLKNNSKGIAEVKK